METEVEVRKPVLLPCAECSSEFAPSITRTNICPTCISKNNDITAGIPKELLLQWCRYCSRFYGPPWLLCQRESKELLSLCLKKVKGINKLKLLDAAFVYTEPHSKRTKLRLTVQKELKAGITLQQSFEVEFTEIYTQCDDCKKDFTPHTWMACVQIRQKTDNRKTFFYLEQLMLKHGAHKKASKISTEKHGLNFFFTKRSDATKLIEFVQAVLPTSVRESKELISHNVQNSDYNYKFTTVIEIPKICKDDLVVLPKKLCKEFGGMNSLAICFKVGVAIHLFDPITLKKVEMIASQYFAYQNDLKSIPFKSNETEFFVSDIRREDRPKMSLDSTFTDIEKKFARADVTRSSDFKTFECTTHMGHILNHGDTAIGYDLTTLNCEDLEELQNQKYLPDVILVRKTYPERKKRFWKLKRIEMEEEAEDKHRKPEEEEKQFQEFMDELEQDKTMRARVNIVGDDKVIKELSEEELKKNKNHKEMVQLEELMKDMNIDENKKVDEKDIEKFIGDIDQLNFKKK